MKARQLRPDAEPVTERASALAAQSLTQYWIVLSYQDGAALLQGVVPATVRQQVVRSIKRSPEESADEYVARVGQSEVA